ncbi:MAG: hypothetical protein H0U27_14100 [Nitrosopumilus sp.]|nr:hypothetical protein [Nitrosopumilus sp.]
MGPVDYNKSAHSGVGAPESDKLKGMRYQLNQEKAQKLGNERQKNGIEAPRVQFQSKEQGSKIEALSIQVQSKDKESKIEKAQFLLGKAFDGLKELKNSFGNFCAIGSTMLKFLTSLKTVEQFKLHQADKMESKAQYENQKIEFEARQPVIKERHENVKNNLDQIKSDIASTNNINYYDNGEKLASLRDNTKKLMDNMYELNMLEKLIGKFDSSELKNLKNLYNEMDSLWAEQNKAGEIVIEAMATDRLEVINGELDEIKSNIGNVNTGDKDQLLDVLMQILHNINSLTLEVRDSRSLKKEEIEKTKMEINNIGDKVASLLISHLDDRIDTFLTNKKDLEARKDERMNFLKQQPDWEMESELEVEPEPKVESELISGENDIEIEDYDLGWEALSHQLINEGAESAKSAEKDNINEKLEKRNAKLDMQVRSEFEKENTSLYNNEQDSLRVASEMVKEYKKNSQNNESFNVNKIDVFFKDIENNKINDYL